MTKTNIILIFLIMLFVCSCAIISQKLPEFYKQNISAIVRTSGMFPGRFPGSLYKGYASGFVINKQEGLILTAAHLIENIKDVGIEFCLGFKKKIPIEIVAVDVDNDIALIRTTMDLTSPLLDFMPELELNTNPIVGEKIFCIGNPDGFKLVVSSGILSSNIVYPSNFWVSFPRGVYITDYASVGGMSGSPVFDMSGRIIGMNVGYYYSFAVVVPALSIDTFLKENGYRD